jgi:hypothetical protein
MIVKKMLLTKAIKKKMPDTVLMFIPALESLKPIANENKRVRKINTKLPMVIRFLCGSLL